MAPPNKNSWLRPWLWRDRISGTDTASVQWHSVSSVENLEDILCKRRKKKKKNRIIRYNGYADISTICAQHEAMRKCWNIKIFIIYLELHFFFFSHQEFMSGQFLLDILKFGYVNNRIRSSFGKKFLVTLFVFLKNTCMWKNMKICLMLFKHENYYLNNSNKQAVSFFSLPLNIYCTFLDPLNTNRLT